MNKMEQKEIFTDMNEAKKYNLAPDDTVFGIPMPGDNYDICSLASKSHALHFEIPQCEDSKDPKIFGKFCDGNYQNCDKRKKLIGGDN